MAQITVDTDTTEPSALRLLAQFLNDMAGPNLEFVVEKPSSKDITPPPPPPPPADFPPRADMTTMFGQRPDGRPLLNNAPPPPPPPAIVQELTAAANRVTAAAIDSAGVPWDERIHSATRSTKLDGTWKVKKGLDKKILAKVMKEITPEAPAAGAAAPVIPAPPRTAAVAPAPPPPPSVSVEVANSFRNLMLKITSGISSKRLSPDAPIVACRKFGLESVSQLASMPALIDVISAELDSMTTPE